MILYRRRQWHPTPVFLPGKSHGWRSLVGCSPWGREESDTTERLPFHFSLSCIGEVFLCLTKHTFLQVYPCCCKWQIFILFNGWVVVHFVCVCVCVYHIFLIHSSIDGHLDCLHILALINKHWEAYIFSTLRCIYLLNSCFHFLWIYTQHWNFWIIQ